MTNTIEHDGDIVMVARVGANAGKVNFFSGRCGVTDNTLVIRVKENTIHPKFLAYFLENFDLHKLIFGSGQPLVTGGQLKKIQSPVIAYKAQLLITRSLESLDRIIGTQDTYMEKLIQLSSFPRIAQIDAIRGCLHKGYNRRSWTSLTLLTCPARKNHS